MGLIMTRHLRETAAEKPLTGSCVSSCTVFNTLCRPFRLASAKEGRVYLSVDGGTLVVEDEGSGIDPEDLPHIFERFYRGKGYGGSFGLGLSICRDLVEGMGGEISLRPREDAGTAAEIRLREADA